MEVARIVGAAATGAADPSGAVSAVCTDTRQMTPGSLFVALRGEHFDGHEFLEQAARGGAIAALVDRLPPAMPAHLRAICVPDARAAMGKLAKSVRSQLRGKVIAVAGSNGKTSTKCLIESVLRTTLRGSVSPKSFNNNVGVPLSIFPADAAQDYLVLELGTNHPGEIGDLTRIAAPDIAIITNCAQEHLEGLGDLDGVRRENASIIEGLAPGGLLIAHGDDAELVQIIDESAAKRILFGFGPDNDLVAEEIECAESGTSFSIASDGPRAWTPMLGKHVAANALAAIAVGRAMGLADKQIVAGLRTATAPPMRLQLRRVGAIRILNDAYNANPASMRAAVEMLATLPARCRRLAVLGDMLELGDHSAEAHRQIGRIVARDFPPDLLICVGAQARTIADAAVSDGFPADRVEHFRSAADKIAKLMLPGDLVLLKASRAIGLEAVERAIADGCQFAERQRLRAAS